MKGKYRLIFKYLFFTTKPIKFLSASTMAHSTTTVFIYNQHLFYLFMHIRLASWFYTSQLVDLFAYETPGVISNEKRVFGVNTIKVYNFSSMLQQSRFLFFIKITPKTNLNKTTSISDLFLNAWWLEREMSEMSGIVFGGQRDSRNLLLMYGDSSTPFIKSFPSIGTRELFFDSTVDHLIQTPVSIQF